MKIGALDNAPQNKQNKTKSLQYNDKDAGAFLTAGSKLSP